MCKADDVRGAAADGADPLPVWSVCVRAVSSLRDSVPFPTLHGTPEGVPLQNKATAGTEWMYGVDIESQIRIVFLPELLLQL